MASMRFLLSLIVASVFCFENALECIADKCEIGVLSKNGAKDLTIFATGIAFDDGAAFASAIALNVGFLFEEAELHIFESFGTPFSDNFGR